MNVRLCFSEQVLGSGRPNALMLCRWPSRLLRLDILLLAAVMFTAGCGKDSPTQPDPQPEPVRVPRIVFQDDFEGDTCLAKWTVSGRRAEGVNTADCVERNGSKQGHMYKSSFTEIMLSPIGRPWPYTDSLLFTYDFRVRVYSSGGAPSNYYGRAGVEYLFMSDSVTTIGRVGYIAATTSYPFDQVANDTANAFIPLPTDTDMTCSLSVGDVLSHIPRIDRSRITGVIMLLKVYSSTRPIPYVNGELWIDNVKVLAGTELVMP